MNYILFGGSGEVGWAVARELLKSDVCSKLIMLGRRVIASMQNEPVVSYGNKDMKLLILEAHGK